MRITLIICLILVSAALSAAEISLDCDGTPVETVIADIARQSGQKITLAAPTDVKITAKVTDFPVEQSLELIARLCEGIYLRVDGGYRLYPRISAEYALEAMRSSYARFKDIEMVTESKPPAGSQVLEASISRVRWKSTRRWLTDTESTAQGKTSRSIAGSDGQFVWKHQSDSCEMDRRKVEEPKHNVLERLPIGVSDPRAIETLADLQAGQLPNLKYLRAEIREGRAVYVMQYEFEPQVWMYDPVSGRKPTLEDKSLMATATGSLHYQWRGLDIAYVYERPRLDLDAETLSRLTFGLDADTGLVIFTEPPSGDRSRRIDGRDWREAAPGISIPFRIVSTESRPGKETRETYGSVITRVVMNSGLDDKTFSISAPKDVFLCDLDLDRAACEEALKAQSDDPDLLYRHGQLLSGTYVDQDVAVRGFREFERALSLRPAAKPKALRRLFEVAQRVKDKDAVRKYGEELRKANPGDHDIDLLVARSYIPLGMKQEALEEFGRVCAAYEDRAEAPLDELASLCLQLGDKARAERLYLEILKIGNARKCEGAVDPLKGIYTADKKPEALRAPLEAAVKRLPESQELRARYGILLSELNEPDAAMRVFREVAKACQSGWVLSPAVRQLRLQGNFGSAKEVADILLKRKDGVFGKSSVLSELVDIYKTEKMPADKAVAICVQYADDDSAISSFQYMFREMKVLPQAIDQVTKAWKADPTNTRLARFVFELAQASWYEWSDDTTANVAAMKQLIAAWPDKVPLYGALGEIYISGKDYPEAEQAFRKAIELAPDQPYYYGQLAYVYNLAGEHDKAGEVARRLVDKEPSNFRFRCVLGSAYTNAGKYREAVDQFNKADEIAETLRQMSRRSESVLDALVLCYTKLKDMSSVEQILIRKVERSDSFWNRANAVQGLAAFYANNGRHDKAASALIALEKGAAKGDANNLDYTIAGVRWQIPHQSRADFAAALEAALRDEPGLADCRMLLAGLYVEQRNTGSAEKLIAEIADYAWDAPTVLAKVGQLITHDQAYCNTAIKIYSRLAILDPTPKNDLILAQAYKTAAMRDKAIELARKLVRTVGNETYVDTRSRSSAADIVSGSASIYVAYSLWDDAIDAYNLAVEFKPDNREQYEMSIASIYSKRGDVDAALAMYNRIGEQAQEVYRKVDALSEAAYIYERRQQIDEAVKCWKKVISASDRDHQKQDAQKQIDRLTATKPPTGSSAPVPGR